MFSLFSISKHPDFSTCLGRARKILKKLAKFFRPSYILVLLLWITFHFCFSPTTQSISPTILATEIPALADIELNRERLITLLGDGQAVTPKALLVNVNDPVTVIPIYKRKQATLQTSKVCYFPRRQSWLTQKGCKSEDGPPALNGGFVESSRGGRPLISWPPNELTFTWLTSSRSSRVLPPSAFDRRKNLARGAGVKNK